MLIVTPIGHEAKACSCGRGRGAGMHTDAFDPMVGLSAVERRTVFTCVIRYRVEPGKLEAFREYAHAWIALIRKYGGTHHGYFVPGTAGDDLPEPGFSFPGLGSAGPDDAAFALFTFPSVEAYDRYRVAVADDEACKAATARFNETKCFTGYERSFLVPIFE
jgi:hypothetical protein